MSSASKPEAGDALARRAAQTIFDRPVIVEAGAGTGKTTILVSRVLSWVLGTGWETALVELGEPEARLGSPSLSNSDTEAEPSIERIAAKTLESVVAITFTEAAAAEMAGRVAERLAEVATGQVSATGFDPELVVGATGQSIGAEVLGERARALLGQLDRMTACTIHAFCHALLRRHPLEARLHPDFAIDARGERLEEIVRGVVESRIKRAYAEESVGTSPLLELAAYGKSPQSVAEALSAFAFEGVPSAALETDPFHPDIVDEIASSLGATMQEFLDLADGDLLGMKRTKNPALVHRTLELSLELLGNSAKSGSGGLAQAQGLCAGLASLWEDSPWTHLKKWARGSFGKAETETFGDRCADLAELAATLKLRITYLRQAKPEFLDAARRALAPLLAEIEREARSAGVITFQALLRDAWRLLHKHPRILRRERRAIRQLLVDEFQDTDRLQCDIVEALALPRSEGSRADDPASEIGLFIVGDPKQSIYGWRNADLEAYDRLVDLALAAGGERHALVRNFRSRPEVLAEVERAIEPVMVEEKGLQPPFEPLVASAKIKQEPTLGDRWSPVEYWVSWHPDFKAKTRHSEAAEIEARAIAQDIRALHDAGTEWKDCALLLRNASRVDTYLDGFRDAGVPFVVTSDKQYFRRREVIDASALLRAVVSPADHVALLTWLRSPIVGVPDAALIPLWSRDFPRLMTDLEGRHDQETLTELDQVVEQAAAAVPTDLPGLDQIRGWESVLARSIHTLAELRTAFSEEPADRFIERLRHAFQSEAIEGARYLGRYRVANLERFFRSIQLGLEARAGDVQAVLRLLRRSVTLALDAEEALPKDAAENAVQVMTIHKAKGLEFGHVYLAQLHAEGRYSERNVFDADRRWNELGQLEFVLFDVPTLGFDAVERHRERVSTAEQVRTLYVALTRAQKRLVLVGNWPDTVKPGRSAQPTYVELLSRRKNHPESIGKMAPAAGLLTEGVVDAAGVRWKFPGLATAEEGIQVPPTLQELPSAEQVRSHSKKLHASREQAMARMARPILARASLGESDHHFSTEASSGQQPYPRPVAMAIGSAVHCALETWDVGADIETELERQSQVAKHHIEGLLDGDALAFGLEEIEEHLVRLARGELLARLGSEPEHVVAREFPVLIPTPRASGEDAAGAIAGVTGTVDLLLADEQGKYTVVDFKTDRVEDESALEERAAAYAPQLAAYAIAVRDGLGLEELPKTELWFLWPDRLWPVA